MAVLRTEHVAQSFGDREIFRRVSVALPRGGKVGLVGPNGVGKTTLLLILAGFAEPSRGSVRRAKAIRIGYLPQEATDAFQGSGTTLAQELEAVFADLAAEEQALAEIADRIGRLDADEALLEQYGRRLERFELAGGYTYRQRIRQVACALGFDDDSAGQPIGQLSGGQKTRALLARLLLEEPDVLMLDEPTNHLDLAAIEWLEGLLQTWSGAVIVVSHDRYLLDRVVDTVWELTTSGVETYRGNYSAFVHQRRDRWAQRSKEHEAFLAHAEKEMEFIRRNIAAQQTSMATGKLARLGREIEAVHAGGLEVLPAIRKQGWLRATAGLAMSRPASNVAGVAARLAQIRPPHGSVPEIAFTLEPAHRGGDIVLRSRDLVVGYPGRRLLECDDIDLTRGGRIAVTGDNGTGKTTLLRTILGQIAPLAGQVRLGANLDIGYFPQAHDYLAADRSLLEALLAAENMPIGAARSYLARFLFTGDEVYQQIGSLSGGERARLALALLALRRPNLLLLDEPTNHLDVPSQELLQEVIESFGGTAILVSHDRYLIDRIATQLWLIADGRLRVFAGTYRELRETARASGPAAAEANSPSLSDRPDDEATVDGPSLRPLSKNELHRRRLRRDSLEQHIVRLESELAQAERELQQASEHGDLAALERYSQVHRRLRSAIDEAYEQWASIADADGCAEPR